METVVLVLMILVCFNFMLKQTYRKLRSVLAISVICALFVGLMWSYAIEQSKTQIADWLANPALMLDTSVVLSVEVVLQMTFCMLAAHIQSAGLVKKRVLWAYKALRWFPGILVFPVLFCGLVALIFSFPGVSFSLIAWSMAAAVFVLIPARSASCSCDSPLCRRKYRIFSEISIFIPAFHFPANCQEVLLLVPFLRNTCCPPFHHTRIWMPQRNKPP